MQSALPYIKVKLLKGLQLLGAAQVSGCVGQPSIEGEPGIHLGSNSLTDNIRGGLIDLEGGRFLGVLASAAPYRMLIRVLAPEQQPHGVYRLDNIGYFDIEGPTNGVLLGHDTDTFRARTSARGLVLVSEYSPQRIAGAVRTGEVALQRDAAIPGLAPGTAGSCSRSWYERIAGSLRIRC